MIGSITLIIRTSYRTASKDTHRITCKYSNAFQHLEPCRVAIRNPMPDPREGLQSPCSGQHQDIILTHAVALDHDLNHWWKSRLCEYLAAYTSRYGTQRPQSELLLWSVWYDKYAMIEMSFWCSLFNTSAVKLFSNLNYMFFWILWSEKNMFW